jgi:DNA-binding SARP family transcriptional activator
MQQLPLPAQRLVAYLAIHGGRPTRDALAESLWPGRARDLARLNLRQAVYHERRACHGLIQATRGELWLAPSVTVDFHLINAGLRRLLANNAERGALDESDLADDLLPGWDDEWLEPERERYRELRLQGLEMLSKRWLRDGLWARAIDAALAVAGADPLRETARALLIRAYLGQQNVASALRVLDSYRELVRRELGLEPSPELTDLFVARPTGRQ